jgi:hypothetical protein
MRGDGGIFVARANADVIDHFRHVSMGLAQNRHFRCYPNIRLGRSDRKQPKVTPWVKCGPSGNIENGRPGIAFLGESR